MEEGVSPFAVDSSAVRQSEMFPDDVPAPAFRYWAAVDRWWATGTFEQPTQEQFAAKFDPPIGVRTLYRLIHSEKTRNWCPWPLVRGMRRPWLPLDSNGSGPEPDGQVVRFAVFNDDGAIVAMPGIIRPPPQS